MQAVMDYKSYDGTFMTWLLSCLPMGHISIFITQYVAIYSKVGVHFAKSWEISAKKEKAKWGISPKCYMQKFPNFQLTDKIVALRTRWGPVNKHIPFISADSASVIAASTKVKQICYATCSHITVNCWFMLGSTI